MRLLDLIRSSAIAERDALGNIEHVQRDRREARGAAEDEYKRISTLISQLHAQEREARRAMGGVESRIAQVRDELEELDRRRMALHERLLECQTEQEAADGAVGETRTATQSAEVKLADARDRAARLDHELKDLERDRHAAARRCTEVYRRAVFQYLTESAARLDEALATETENARRQKVADALREARHADRSVGDLCDQRDQYLELLKLATVPGVKSTVEAALRGIESELDRRFPGAFALREPHFSSSAVEELYYYRDASDLTTLLLPIDDAIYSALETGVLSPRTRNAARLVWSLVKQGGLTARDGRFTVRDGFCVFETSLGEDALAALGLTSLNLEGASDFQLTLVPLPTEAKEALLDENSIS